MISSPSRDLQQHTIVQHACFIFSLQISISVFKFHPGFLNSTMKNTLTSILCETRKLILPHSPPTLGHSKLHNTHKHALISRIQAWSCPLIIHGPKSSLNILQLTTRTMQVISSHLWPINHIQTFTAHRFMTKQSFYAVTYA